MKKVKYEEIIKRIDENISQKKYFESSWYSYVIIEDRLISMLNQTGGSTVIPKAKKKKKMVNSQPQTIRMLGPKIGELKLRSKNDRVLESLLYETENSKKINLLDKLSDWKDKRDQLTHQVVNDDSMSIVDIDKLAESTAEEGRNLVRKFAAIARTLKKRKNK